MWKAQKFNFKRSIKKKYLLNLLNVLKPNPKIYGKRILKDLLAVCRHFQKQENSKLPLK